MTDDKNKGIRIRELEGALEKIIRLSRTAKDERGRSIYFIAVVARNGVQTTEDYPSG